jgi:hypothetical protein
MLRRGRVPAATLLLVPVLAGCLGGGGGGSSGGGGTQLSAAEYRSQAAAICTSYRAKLAKLPTPSDLAGLAEQGTRAVDLQQEEVNALRRLTPPDSMADQTGQMLDAVEQAIGDGRKLITAARSAQPVKVTAAVASLRGHLTTANTLAKQLDLGACAITA